MKFNGSVFNQENPSNLKTQTDTEVRGMINQLPTDTLKEVFARLDWASLTTISQVNLLWHSLVSQLSQDLIRKYFPYLTDLQTFNENPLKLLVQECLSYQSDFPEIEMSLVLAALSGNREVIATVKEQNVRIVLYSLFSANNHKLPDDLSQEEEIQIHIHISKSKQYARMGKLDDLKKCLSSIRLWNLTGTMLGQIFRIASRNGQVEIVAYLLTLNILKRIPRDDILAALKLTASNGHLDVIKLISPLNFWADPIWVVAELYVVSTSFEKGEVIEAAAEKGHLEILKFLLPQEDALISSFAKDNALCKAAKNGHLEVVKYLMVENYSDKVITLGNRRCPLCEAAKHGQLEIVKYLLSLNELSIERKKVARQEAQNKGYFSIATLIQDNIDAVNNKNNSKNVSRLLNFLKNFLNAPTHHPLKIAILLGLLPLICSVLFISLKSRLILSGLLSLYAYMVIRVRNYFIQQAQNRNISNADKDPVFVCREKNDTQKHDAYLNGYNAANSWIIYFRDSRKLNNWKYASYYGLGMKIGRDQAEKIKMAKPFICSF